MSEVPFVNCPLCSHSRVLKGRYAWKPEPFEIDPADFHVLTVREQKGGKGTGGFFNIPGRERTIADLFFSDDDFEKIVAEALKERLLSVVRAWHEAGVLTEEDLKPFTI